MNEQVSIAPATSSEMLTYLRERLGGQTQLSRAISELRASLNYKGDGSTYMGAVWLLYQQEKHKQSA